VLLPPERTSAPVFALNPAPPPPFLLSPPSPPPDVFKNFHANSPTAEKHLGRFLQGELVGEDGKPVLATTSAPAGDAAAAAFELDVRALSDAARAEGLYNANLPYYAWKFFSTVAIAAAAALVTARGAAAGSVGQQLAGAALLAVFWQQCGWLAHDFGHHQVFKARLLNDVGILVVGNLFQGFSCEWWKNKHNTHHAVPNLHESADGAHDGDPDIDTMPFLAWSARMLKQAGSFSPASRALLQWQAFTYFPLLLFARLTWALQSAAFAFQFEDGLFANNEVAVARKVAAEKGGELRGLKHAFAEKALIVAHYALVAALCFGATSSPAVGLAHLLVAQCGCGMLLAVAFGLGHNGMAVHDAHARPGFAALQVSTTRNVADDALGLTGWFMGGLHLQIEHHLMPGVPRHSLAALAPRVRALCVKHKVPYRCTGMFDGTGEVLAHLSEVVRDFPAA